MFKISGKSSITIYNALSRFECFSSNIFVAGISNAQGLAIDWVSRNMYWTNVDESPDEPRSSIHIARLDGSFRNEIKTNGSLLNPRSIVIQPDQGWVSNATVEGFQV